MTPPALRQIDISIAEPFEAQVSEGWLTRVMECALAVALPAGETGQVSLLITGDETVRELNREYRGLDEVTDVLSFSATHAGHWEGDEPPAVPDAIWGEVLKASYLPLVIGVPRLETASKGI